MRPPVIDAQVHVWRPESADRPWTAGGREWAAASHRSEPITGDGLLTEMAAAGVHRAVLVPPFFEGNHNDYAIECARAHPEAYRVMVRADLNEGRAQGDFRDLLADPLVPGIRLTFLPADAGPIAEAPQWLWELGAELDVPIAVLAPQQSPAVGAIARAYPQLRLAVDHLGLSGQAKDVEVAPEIDELVALAALDNVSVKATSAPTYSTEPYPYPALLAQLHRLIDAFGIERVFWGSDLSRLRGNYPDLVRLFAEDLGLPARDRDAVLGGSLAGWLRWDTADTAQPREFDG